MAFSIILRSGQRVVYSAPVVMGIINVTTDSFYAGSRVADEQTLRERVISMVRAGAQMIDVGAYSTRPGHVDVPAEEEMRRYEWALPVIISAIHETGAQILVSVDTFRPEIAECCITRLGADIINDVSGGCEEMAEVVRRTQAPYILMHPETVSPDVNEDVLHFFESRVPLYGDGVILDPGFGFGKTMAQNFELMNHMEELKSRFPNLPLLVGISRKRMVWQTLNLDADHALNGTTVLNTISLLHGADILRVHDVNEAVEAVKLVGALLS